MWLGLQTVSSLELEVSLVQSVLSRKAPLNQYVCTYCIMRFVHTYVYTWILPGRTCAIIQLLQLWHLRYFEQVITYFRSLTLYNISFLSRLMSFVTRLSDTLTGLPSPSLYGTKWTIVSTFGFHHTTELNPWRKPGWWIKVGWFCPIILAMQSLFPFQLLFLVGLAMPVYIQPLTVSHWRAMVCVQVHVHMNI